MSTERKALFVGSSSEGLPIAEAIPQILERDLEVITWPNIFVPSQYTLESLGQRMKDFDAAAFVLSPDDWVQSRGKRRLAPRDNVLLEIGLSIGCLGRQRTFLIIDRTVETKLPSDLHGVNVATYQPHRVGSWVTALLPACLGIRDAIQKL